MENYWIILLQDIKEKIISYHTYTSVEYGYDSEFFYELPKLYNKINEVLDSDDLDKYDDDEVYYLCNQARRLFKKLNGKKISKTIHTKLYYDDILDELKNIDIIRYLMN